MKTIHFVAPLVASVLAYAMNPAVADTFGSGANAFEIEFVTIGDPGNPPDTSGDPNPAGSVDYVYRIGKYEISREMFEKGNAEGGLGITLQDMSAAADNLDMIGFGGNGPSQPATGVDWFEALTFANWLNSSSGHPVAYKFNAGAFELWQPGDTGYDPDNLFRSSQAHYFTTAATATCNGTWDGPSVKAVSPPTT